MSTLLPTGVGACCEPLCHSRGHPATGQKAHEACWWWQSTGPAQSQAVVGVVIAVIPSLVQEERGAYFGHVFALVALIQSGRVVEPVRGLPCLH